MKPLAFHLPSFLPLIVSALDLMHISIDSCQPASILAPCRRTVLVS